MDTIQYALSKFIQLFDYKYKFVIVYKKKLCEVELTFEKKDFYHLAGFQYLIDIDIPKVPNNLKNLICKYVRYMNQYSKIEAEYLIKSTLHHKTAYIFIRKRRKENTYCICSFFIEPETDYNGIKIYWLFKSKINTITTEETILYDRLNKEQDV